MPPEHGDMVPWRAELAYTLSRLREAQVGMDWLGRRHRVGPQRGEGIRCTEQLLAWLHQQRRGGGGGAEGKAMGTAAAASSVLVVVASCARPRAPRPGGRYVLVMLVESTVSRCFVTVYAWMDLLVGLTATEIERARCVQRDVRAKVRLRIFDLHTSVTGPSGSAVLLLSYSTQ